MAHHRVELVQGSNDCFNVCNRFAGVFREQLISSSLVGTNSCSGGSRKRMVIGLPSIASYMASKSPCCIGSSFASAFSRPSTVSETDHFTDRRNTICLEEHVLGTAEANALSTKFFRLFRITRIVCIGADFQECLEFVSPSHQAAKFTGDRSFHSRIASP